MSHELSIFFTALAKLTNVPAGKKSGEGLYSLGAGPKAGLF